MPTSSPSGVSLETLVVRTPEKPNGKLVIALHGHESSGAEIAQTASMIASWDALTGAGFTVVFPDLGGNAWANDTAMTELAEVHRLMVEKFELDPQVYCYGISMGGGTTLTAIAKKVIPVRAAYLAHPSCDMRPRWAQPAKFPTMQAAYAGVEADMLDHNPMSQPEEAFAGVPMLFTASAGDTTTPRTVHTDAFRSLLGSVTSHEVIDVTGEHMDPSHFRAQDALEFFATHA